MPRVLTRIPPSWRKRLMDAGIHGRSDYVRFVVLGRSRVGSNLLRGLLNAHPNVVAFGEIFRDASSGDWDHTGYFQSRAMRRFQGDDPVRFVDTRVFGRYPPAIEAVGFKIFYYHARDGRSAAIWPYLERHRDLKIIHLTRTNVLHTHLSRKRAALTDRWVDTSGRSDDPIRVELAYEELLRDFEQTRAWEQEGERFFSAHELLRVEYEQLSADHRAEARRIQDFLSVPFVEVHPSTFRQARQPLSDAIVNYGALKRRFAGTPWHNFFTD